LKDGPLVGRLKDPLHDECERLDRVAGPPKCHPPMEGNDG